MSGWVSDDAQLLGGRSKPLSSKETTLELFRVTGSVLLSRQGDTEPCFLRSFIMCDDKKLQFTCQECGAHELGYQKYAKCIAPVSLKENGGVEYGCSEIDENDL